MGPDLAGDAVFVRDRRLLLRGRLPLMTLLFWYTIAMIIGFVFIMVVKLLKLARKPCLDRADHGGRRLLIAEPAAPGQRLPGAEF